MTDRELTPAHFARSIRRSVRTRLMQGKIDSGTDIVALRRFAGLTQEAFAEALGISVHTLPFLYGQVSCHLTVSVAGTNLGGRRPVGVPNQDLGKQRSGPMAGHLSKLGGTRPVQAGWPRLGPDPGRRPRSPRAQRKPDGDRRSGIVTGAPGNAEPQTGRSRRPYPMVPISAALNQVEVGQMKRYGARLRDAPGGPS